MYIQSSEICWNKERSWALRSVLEDPCSSLDLLEVNAEECQKGVDNAQKVSEGEKKAESMSNLLVTLQAKVSWRPLPLQNTGPCCRRSASWERSFSDWGLIDFVTHFIHFFDIVTSYEHLWVSKRFLKSGDHFTLYFRGWVLVEGELERALWDWSLTLLDV